MAARRTWKTPCVVTFATYALKINSNG